MNFEEAVLKSRAGAIRVSPGVAIKYVIFENIAKHLGVDAMQLGLLEEKLMNIAQAFRVQPSDELLYEYHMLYYRLAILGYPLQLPPDAQLPTAEMPEAVIDMITRRNQVLHEIYENSFSIAEASLPTKTKTLTWGEMLSAEDGEKLRNDEKETRHYGNHSVEIYQLKEELRKLAYNWREANQTTFLYQYLTTLYKLIILGFDPLEMEVMAEIEESPELPAYYWQSKKT